MSDIRIEDKSGKLYRPEEYKAAHAVISKRMVLRDVPSDIELFMSFPVILDSLRIAEIISRSHYDKT